MRDTAVVHTKPDGLITELAQRGYNGIACPVLSIQNIPFTLTDEYDVALLTSGNAVSAGVQAGLPCVAVGAETALMAREAGIDVIDVGDGDAASLKNRDSLKNRRVIHLAGKHTSPETQSLVNALALDSVCVYEAQLNPDFPEAVMHSLAQGKLGHVLMFSARAARHFTGLAKRATNNDLWRNVTGVALSPRIAAAMDGLPFADLRVASAPNRNALLEALIK